MDDIDRELKKIQLQREKLALERELARQRTKERILGGAVETAAKGADSIGRGFTGATGLIARLWKPFLLLCMLIALGAGGVALVIEREKAAERAEAARRSAAQQAYVLNVCGRPCVSQVGDENRGFSCGWQNLQRFEPCKRAAVDKFDEEWTRTGGKMSQGTPASTPGATPSQIAQVTGAVVVAPAAASGPQATTAPGETLYQSACRACHGTGIAGAPVLGDKSAWAPRLVTGVDGLTANVIKGKGAMPPKGGSVANEAEIKAAVQYMVSKAL